MHVIPILWWGKWMQPHLGNCADFKHVRLNSANRRCYCAAWLKSRPQTGAGDLLVAVAGTGAAKAQPHIQNEDKSEALMSYSCLNLRLAGVALQKRPCWKQENTGSCDPPRLVSADHKNQKLEQRNSLMLYKIELPSFVSGASPRFTPLKSPFSPSSSLSNTTGGGIDLADGGQWGKYEHS